MRDIFRAGEKPQKGAAALRVMLADCSPEHWIAQFERIEQPPGRHEARDLNLHFRRNLRQRLQVLRQHNSNHGRVCTSTDSTGGKFSTIAPQLSPPFGEQ